LQFINLASNFAFLCVIMSLGNRKLNYDLHSFITSVFADLNSFIKNHVTEKVERLNMIFG